MTDARALFRQQVPGYVVGFKNTADKGKTLAMVLYLGYLVSSGRYRGSEVVGNIWIDMPGYTELDNAGIREYLGRMVAEPLTHRIVVIDEINGVFPSRFFKDRNQTENLLGLWQVTKLGNYVLFTHHLGTSIDKIIRDATQISVIPTYKPENDEVHMRIINGIDNTVSTAYFQNASIAFPAYWRWQPVGLRLTPNPW